MTTSIRIDTHVEYNRLFDSSNPNWASQPELNMYFIKSQVQFLQRRLDLHGILFVNEVLQALGFDRTPDGQVSGWLRADGYLAVEANFSLHDSNVIWISFKPQGVVVNDL